MIKINKYKSCKLLPGFIQLLASLVVGTLLFATGCLSDQLPDDAVDNYNNMIVNGKDVQPLTDEARTTPEGIPPIDGQIPSELETATLAMG